MKRRDFLWLLGATAASPRLALAQQAKIPRIVIFTQPIPDSTRLPLIQGLADFGYVDGKTITLEFVTAPSIEAVPQYAAQVVATKPDLIMTSASPPPLALKALTTTIPVVFTGLEDPVVIGLLSNYITPGGNFTGTMNGTSQYLGRQVQIFKEILPGMTKMGVFGLPTDPAFQVQWNQVQSAAQLLNIEALRFDATEGVDIEPQFAKAKDAGVQAAFFIVVTYFNNIAQQLADLALQYKLPAMGRETYARAGMLVGYRGTGYAMNPEVTTGRRGGYYVDLILKGAKPGDLPVEGPTDFTFTVNLKTAKALGITIPPPVIYQATEVVEEGGTLH